MTRKYLAAAIATVLVAGLSASASAQTLTDTVSDGAEDAFFFTMVDSGQARLTVVWQDAPDVLGMIVGCSLAGETVVFATSVSDQDRILTADVGIPDGVDCIAIVEILAGLATNYTINLLVTSPGGNVLDTAQLRPFAAGEETDPRLLKLAGDLRLRAKALRELR
jgi:hypothetical protein